MGTMTQGICQLKHRKETINRGGESKEDSRIIETAGIAISAATVPKMKYLV